MNQADALEALEQLRRSLLEGIAGDLPAKGKRYLGYLIEEQIGAARLHLKALYEAGLEVGPGFTGVAACQGHPKYAFWTEGIRRHIALCETSLRGEPAA